MNWLNLEVSTIRKAEYVGSEPVARATWLNVLAYSCEHENAGRLVGARQWKDRQWQQTCGVMLAEVEAAIGLLKWDGDDLVVWGYPADREAEVRAKRSGGRRGGLKSGKVRAEASREAEVEAPMEESIEDNRSTPSSTPSSTPRTERKGIGRGIGIGKEGECKGEGEPAPPVAPPPAPPGGGGKAKMESAAPTTPEAQRVAALFRKRVTTEWSKGDISTYKKLWAKNLITAENLSEIEAYYAAQRAKGTTGPDRGCHRRDLTTFLNNFTCELDRAREWSHGTANGNGKPKAPQNPNLAGMRMASLPPS